LDPRRRCGLPLRRPESLSSILEYLTQ
jgi:hypothetical protein